MSEPLKPFIVLMLFISTTGFGIATTSTQNPWFLVLGLVTFVIGVLLVMRWFLPKRTSQVPLEKDPQSSWDRWKPFVVGMTFSAFLPMGILWFVLHAIYSFAGGSILWGIISILLIALGVYAMFKLAPHFERLIPR